MKVVFDEIYDQYHQDLYQFVFYMVKDKQITEDLVQEVYLRVLKSSEGFRGESSIKTWLFSIARHVSLDYFRRKQRTRDRIAEYFNWGEKSHTLQDNQPLPDELVIKNEEIKKIYKYLDYCTVDQRSVLILRYIQSLSIQETADILNFTTSKVKTTQHRGLKVLKRHISEYRERGEEI
ncbi:RNA polymerase sigma factor SigX [Oceanobacillus manasiensis]|uniref:RNA polymerase sigma factor SigX n=1 Tax=Oceanobacillus manasiensis TaxID=586413 RepID=UPI0005AAEC48|nr:RNA polymerase sigma factor SigX [Oceanobacillus manasiensis]